MWGDVGIFFLKQERFEFIYYTYLRKFLKKVIKKGVYTFSSRRYWVFIKANLTLSKKSTNSRMGKGKGDPTRRAFKGRVFSPLVEFKGVNPFFIKGFNKFLMFKTRLNTGVIYKNTSHYNNTSKLYSVKTIFRKYFYF